MERRRQGSNLSLNVSFYKHQNGEEGRKYKRFHTYGLKLLGVLCSFKSRNHKNIRTLAKTMQQNTTTASKIWRGVKVFFKWLWLITMFLFGLALYLFLFPLWVFEYSFSLPELDVIEASFIAFLAIYIYRYIKLCRCIDVPLIRKVITPWVHQAYMGLFSFGLLAFSIKVLGYKLEQPIKPLAEIISYLLTVVVFGYSYYRMGKFVRNDVEKIQRVDVQGAAE